MWNARWFLTVILCVVTALTAAPSDQAQKTAASEKVLFGDLPTVEAVSLHAETLAEAPANVTVVTAAEIRRYGYRTLADVLASVRGFYVTNDHTYHYVGVRGVSLPGDYNTRFLVMLNGHPLTDNIYGSNGFFGQDFGLDMSLVERIEIIRGPTSALYGSNGILANINVVTRSPVDAERLRASVETGSGGERKLSLSGSFYLGRGANLVVAASVYNDVGLEFSSFGLGPATPPYAASSLADGERGYHSFANLIWHNWSFTAYFNSRRKQVPVGWGASFIGDPGQHADDRRNFVSAAYKRTIGPGQISWRTAFDQYRYEDRYDYPGGESAVNRTYDRGDWVNSDLTYTLDVPHMGALATGVTGFWDLRAEQYNTAGDVRTSYTNNPDRGIALFAQQEWKWTPRWKLDAGVRMDFTRDFGRFLSPRIAVVWQQSSSTAYKFVYGRPFRNPSSFEQYFNDGGLSFAAAPPLHPETADTLELSMERRLRGNWTVILNGYHYRIRQVVEAVELSGDVLQYRNAGQVRSSGLEIELSGRVWDVVEASFSTAAGFTHDRDTGGRLANAPTQVSKIRFGVPLLRGPARERLFLSADLQYQSSRDTWGGDRLGGAAVAGVAVTARVHPHFDVQAGLHNALDRRYEDPIYLAADRLRGDGRSAFLSLIWRPWE